VGLTDGEILHITEENSGFSPRDSVKVIRSIDHHERNPSTDSLTLDFSGGKGNRISFESGPLVSEPRHCYKVINELGAAKFQEYTIIQSNYDKSKENVNFECLGVIFIRHADAR
jgi:hypothetical protein